MVAKTARGKRVLEKREPKLNEDPKQTIFIRGKSRLTHNTSRAMKELYFLKRNSAKMFKKKTNNLTGDIMMDPKSLEFFSSMSDASMFLVGSSSKKRGDCLILGRTFDCRMLDMYELKIQNVVQMNEMDSPKCTSTCRPLILFQGEWDSGLQSMLLDFFYNDRSHPWKVQNNDLEMDLCGLEHCIVLTSQKEEEEEKIFLRVYTINSTNTGPNSIHQITTPPKVDLIEMGPRMDFLVRRKKEADEETLKNALKQEKVQKIKNVNRTKLGSTHGRVHVGRQDLEKLASKRMKALRKR